MKIQEKRYHQIAARLVCSDGRLYPMGFPFYPWEFMVQAYENGDVQEYTRLLNLELLGKAEFTEYYYDNGKECTRVVARKDVLSDDVVDGVMMALIEIVEEKNGRSI
jgi:hypothetical protein